MTTTSGSTPVPSLSMVVSLVAAILLMGGLGTSKASDPSDTNLLINSDLKSEGSRIPFGWKAHTVPNCGFQFSVHQHADSPNEFEIINSEPVETTFQQVVHLKPGWYNFTAEIKIESLGSEGSPPELFVKASNFPVESKVHPLEWTNEWKKYHLLFKAGPTVPDFGVGCSLGGWGSPNSGRILFRNPSLVFTLDPESIRKKAGLEVESGYDIEGIAARRYVQLSAKGTQVSRGSKKSVLGKRWSIIALIAGLLMVAILGWRAVSPKDRRRG